MVRLLVEDWAQYLHIILWVLYFLVGTHLL